MQFRCISISILLFFIYENNKRNTNYALTGPSPNPNLDWHCRRFPGTHIICMWISIFMTGDGDGRGRGEAPTTMAYVIWKIFMKQYARLRYDPQPLSPRLIWHSYAAIRTVGLLGVTMCSGSGYRRLPSPFIDLN